jgi:protein SCO1/2
VDKNGKTVRWSDFDGRYRIVYFGYTFCPDACPTDMAVAMRGLDFTPSHPQQAARSARSSSRRSRARHAAGRGPVRRRLLAARHRADRHARAGRQGRQAFAVYYARGKQTRAAI